MRTALRWTACAVMLLLAFGSCLASATHDLRFNKKQDAEGDTLFYVETVGTRAIEAKLEVVKVCSGISNTKKHKVRTVRVWPKHPLQLDKAWSQTSCRRRYRVLEARYL